MIWIKCSDRKPTKEDSPIIAIRSFEYFEVYAVHYDLGWDGIGWYTADLEYGIGLNKNEAFYQEHCLIKYWMPLPESPKD